MKNQNKLLRRLLAASLLIGGPFQLVTPLLAQTAPRLTTANTSISNTATATYDDADPNTPQFNATSNTVTITVAEVAGINIRSTSFAEAGPNPGTSIQPGDVINFDFAVTNTGNDATRFIIPNTASVNQFGTVTAVQYFDGTNYVNVPAGGFTTGSIAVNGEFQVRVIVTVNANARANSQIIATLGNTTPAGNSASTQNQPFVAGGPNDPAGDVRTADNPGAATGELNPTNVLATASEREASASSSAATVGVVLGLSNGPNNAPNAIGPTNSNDDFTNVSTNTPGVAPTDPNGAFNPDPVTITNTIQGSPTEAATVSLLPTVPTNPAAIPDSTLVTISSVTGTPQTAVYEYDQPTATYTVQSGTTTPNNSPVRISLPAGQTANYTVKVDLPKMGQLTGVPVPITAFVDFDNNGAIAFTDGAGGGTVNGRYDPGEEDATQPANTTIDRVYIGYLNLVKTSRILNSDGTPVVGTDSEFNDTAKSPTPGNIIEYQIVYTNISDPDPVSTNPNALGNVLLNATSVAITENGTANGNNWALDNDNTDADNNTATGIDTSHVTGAVTATSGIGSVTFNPGGERSGVDQASDVTEYIVNAGSLAPQGATGTGNGTFTFQRRVN